MNHGFKFENTKEWKINEFGNKYLVKSPVASQASETKQHLEQ